MKRKPSSPLPGHVPMQVLSIDARHAEELGLFTVALTQGEHDCNRVYMWLANYENLPAVTEALTDDRVLLLVPVEELVFISRPGSDGPYLRFRSQGLQ